MDSDKFKSFRDLIAWQKAMNFVVRIYEETARLPDSERFGLVSQLRRTAVSVPSNIAEGHALRGQGNFARFLRTALGSQNEIQTQLELALRISHLSQEAYRSLDEKAQEISKILTALIRSIERKLPPTQTLATTKHPTQNANHSHNAFSATSESAQSLRQSPAPLNASNNH